MHHGEGEANGYRSVHGVSAGLHDLHTGTRRQFVDARHHAMSRMRGTERRGR
jgi:hypothetical protein